MPPGDEILNITRSKDGVHAEGFPRQVTLRDSPGENRHIALAANMMWDLDVDYVAIRYRDGTLETIERM